MRHGRHAEASPDGPSAALGRGRAGLLYATVFASGAAVMIVEMTAVRTIQPFFGSTTYVWTNVIAVVLAALAMGYAVGGRLADRYPRPRLLYLLLAAGGSLVALGALLATPVSRLFLQEGVDLEGVVSVLLWGSLGASLLLFAPPILLLGMVAPLAIRLLADRGVGRAAGSVFALSTTGSIVGTYLPTLFLIPRLGSRGSILVAAGILLVSAAAGLWTFGRGGRRLMAWLASLAMLGGIVSLTAAGTRGVPPRRPVPPLVGGTARLLEELESPYQYLTVRDDAWPDITERVLTINEGVYSFHALQVRGRVLTGSRFYDAYAVLPFLLDLSPGDPFRGCIVGLACGVNARQWHHFFSARHDVRVDGAEIDPGVIELGRRYFDLPSQDAPWLRTVALDGRTLLECLPETTTYDAIVVDAFAHELYVPFHLATHEFFALCHRRLEPGGMLAMNVHAYEVDAPNLTAIENTLATVFPHVLRVPHYEAGGFLLLARRGDAGIDLERLTLGAIDERYGSSDGAPRRRPPAEWDDLVALADDIHATARTSARRITARAEARRLTDDHAPLEWLTDRFLWAEERALLEAEHERGHALEALRTQQRTLLVVIAAGWACLLAGLGLAVRTRR